MKRLESPSRQRHLDIYDFDWEYISDLWGKAGRGRRAGTAPIGTAAVIRSIIHKWVLSHQQFVAQAQSQVQGTHPHANPSVTTAASTAVAHDPPAAD